MVQAFPLSSPKSLPSSLPPKAALWLCWLQCQGISPSSLPVLGHADAAPLHWPCDCSAEGSLPGCWAGGGGKVCVCTWGVFLAPL